MQFEQLIKKIKLKKELSGIDDSIVLETLKTYLEKNKISLEKLPAPQMKIVIKDIRSKLRNYAGRFQISTKDRNKILEKEDIESLLKTHSSTKERIDFYPKIKELISKLKINSILDFGCGINPIALATPEITYYASDINTKELKFIEKFFAEKNIKGKTFFCDLTKIEKCSLPEADLCLILKVFDIIGKNNFKTAEKIITNIKSRYILASFSTRTLSGKPMNKPRRIWFEKLLEKQKISFKIIKSGNEIFYFFEKN